MICCAIGYKERSEIVVLDGTVNAFKCINLSTSLSVCFQQIAGRNCTF